MHDRILLFVQIAQLSIFLYHHQTNPRHSSLIFLQQNSINTMSIVWQMLSLLSKGSNNFMRRYCWRKESQVLVMKDEGCLKQRPVMFLSRELKEAEKNYWPTELEAGALIWAISKLNYIVQGSKVILSTNCWHGRQSCHQIFQSCRSRFSFPCLYRFSELMAVGGHS